MKRLLYLCDGKKSCGVNNSFCGAMKAKKTADDSCIDTSEPAYALNGECKDPENHPERFMETEQSFWEILKEDDGE